MELIYNQKTMFTAPRENFQKWKEENSDWEKFTAIAGKYGESLYVGVSKEKGGHPDFKRVVVTFGGGKNSKGEEIKHTYTPLLNVKTGEYYLDCRKRKLFTKFVCFALVRPIHTLALTLFHLLGVGMAVQVVRTLRGKQTLKEGLQNCVKSFADIVRTPLYGMVLTIIDIAAIVFAVFKPNSLYQMREISGKIEAALHRLPKASFRNRNGFQLAPCFLPVGNIADKDDDIVYCAYKLVEFRQKNRVLFNDCWALHPKDLPYQSPAYKGIEA